MPTAGTYLPDESSLSRVRTDPEGNDFLGTDYAFTGGAQTSGNQEGVLLDNLIPPNADIRDALARSSAAGEYQLEMQPGPKYADELFENVDYSLAPEPGQLDGDKGAVLTVGYDPYLTKEPKLRGEPPSTGEIAANTATSPGMSLYQTEEQAMQLLFGGF